MKQKNADKLYTIKLNLQSKIIQRKQLGKQTIREIVVIIEEILQSERQKTPVNNEQERFNT